MTANRTPSTPGQRSVAQMRRALPTPWTADLTDRPSRGTTRTRPVLRIQALEN
ncbi:hypothetical protein [Nocardia caishijiensis]|uniref:Transposase n=1 Tax=Nocardia caishijiensis TaxID=184756 RepID=A0ABQ6YLZ4_9NOCA|nr:hypothetical protein [Nocardia caishijiensis]KAF0846808.1 hypothetical protein FNL39_104230 [Nocardia caishijiensis]